MLRRVIWDTVAVALGVTAFLLTLFL